MSFRVEPLAFETPVEAGEYLRKAFDGWIQGLEQPEVDALLSYKGSGYLEINEGLRDGWLDETNESIALLDAAIAKAVLPDPVIAYRALVDYGIGYAPEYLIGATLEEVHFSSTSLVSEVAESYAADAKDLDDAVLSEFVLPAGFTAAPLDLIQDLHEAELLLPRNTQFYVVEVFTDNPYKRARLRWMPRTGP